jgi:glycosyltransferase involved in cell wall biosynthesis
MLSVAIFAGDNDTEHIERCLKSLKPLAAEIVFVDTGTSGKMSAIAKKYTSRVFKEPWRNDFGWHRNHSFGLCTGQWVLQIDADEELIFDDLEKGPDLLLQLLTHTVKEINAVSLTIRDWRKSLNRFVAESDNVRLFRRGKVTWTRRIHNRSIYDGATGVFRAAHLKHYGYDLDPKQKKAKAERTIGLLKESIKDDPTDYESFFYLAQAYGVYGTDDSQTLKYCKKYVSYREQLGKEFNATIYHTMIFIYLAAKDYDNAKDIILAALQNDPNDLDIIYDWLHYGLKTKDPKTIAIAAQRFVYTFENLPKLRLKTHGRFFFNYNLEAYAEALYYVSISHLEMGVIELNKLKDLFKKLPDEKVQVYKDKLIEDLSHLKIRGLIDEPKIITNLNGHNPLLSASGRIAAL